ncbi:DUF3253 domain-containing protein [Corynebacterium heidelbergense]|uniref:DUF3253 domain-containing protein n=1 Tax=Corynebacterium heidelbergense TaxID=2055947 RepID=A0A364V7J2_9CORY|nr:DUF3253 domain-containing protein [Corynebacterium heidelbergense]RAV32612.1 DUF3253 domain-containing protein [Corynebacterium heidelbergense]
MDTTEDGRYIVVKGRRWRATDPGIPENLKTELVRVLMAGRRLLKTEGDPVRTVVQDAKVALGERGEEWWSPSPTEEGLASRLAATMRTMARARPGKTHCPSDAARVVGGTEEWRDLMDLARQVARDLRATGEILITQKGETVTAEEWKGPIRLSAGPKLPYADILAP